MDKEPHVEFVAREGVTIYTGGSGAPHRAGATIRMPKSHAEALEHLRAPALAAVDVATPEAEPEAAEDE
jgi:hypothetical protein